jgi:ATP-dependent DNA helicase RecQ
MNPTWNPALSALGVEYLFPYQELVVSRILESESLRQGVVLPTGAGKSLCFQLPALLFPHPTLVIYPLRSLMSDQKRRCDEAGLLTVILQGGQTKQQRDEVWHVLASSKVHMVLTNPETLLLPSVIERLNKVRFSHVVYDEAHCMTLWGRDFRPKYRELPRALESLKIPRTTAFTATASQAVTSDWEEHLFRGEPWTLIRASADRPNIEFSREPYLSLRWSLTRAVLREKRPAAVFCRSRDGVRQWAHHLHRETGLDVRHYHAGLTREEKTGIESWFHGSRDGVLVCTNAFGMGVDKPDIRTVIHLDWPARTEDYLQEAGRAGRDGKASLALLMFRSTADAPLVAGCWRKKLLHVFGETPENCSGCDYCKGLWSGLPPELTRACGVLAKHVRRLDRLECQALLRGRSGGQWKGLENLYGWGLWKNLDDLTFRDAWQSLEAGGWVVFRGHSAPGLLEVSRAI